MLAGYAQGAEIDGPLAELRSGAAGYYEQDGLASVTSISNSTAAIINSDTYDTFGNLTASTGSFGNPFQYTGRDFDSETGLRYYRARYYDPAIGRFIRSRILPRLGTISMFMRMTIQLTLWTPSGSKLAKYPYPWRVSTHSIPVSGSKAGVKFLHSVPMGMCSRGGLYPHE